MATKPMHSLLLRPTFESKAKLIRGLIKSKKFVGGEKYTLALEIENIGPIDFPGGVGKIEAKCPTAGYSTLFDLLIPAIKKGDKFPFDDKFESDVPMEGFTLFFAKGMRANDNAPVQIFDSNGNLRSENMSFTSIFARSRTEIYEFYMLIFTIVSIILLIIFSLIQIGLIRSGNDNLRAFYSPSISRFFEIMGQF